MKTLIAYSSKYGGTRQCADQIARLLPDGAALHDLDETIGVDIAPYDCVVIGCSVYMGKPRKAAKKFAQANHQGLLEKRLGLFMCSIQDIEKNVLEQFSLAFPKDLMRHAVAMEQIGGIVDFTRLRRLDGFIMNMIAGDLRKKTGSDILSTVSAERLEAFSKQLLQAPDKP